jgi:monoamine oxidase
MPIEEFDRGYFFDILIIGAGAAGLGAARYLMAKRPEARIAVLEASASIGGRARTLRSPSLGLVPIDLGCGWLHGGATNVWATMAVRLGFTIDTTAAPWDDGGIVLNEQMPDGVDAQTAVKSFLGRAAACSVEESDGALADLLQPDDRWNDHINAIGTYINGVELDQASIADFKMYSPGSDPDTRVIEGFGALVSAFGASVPVCVDTVVSRVDHRDRSQVRVDTNRGTLNARAVLLTVSTNVLHSEAIQFIPPLHEKTEAAKRLPLGLANKIFLRVDGAQGLPKDARLFGSSYRTATGAYQLRPFGSDLIEGYFAGRLAHELETAGDRAAFAFAVDELAGFFGNGIRKRLAFSTMSAWGRQSYVGGSYSYAIPGSSADRLRLSAAVDGRLFFAGEACSPSRYSTAHGAYESGVTAAAKLAELNLN